MIEQYLTAFEAADVPGLTRLLADDVLLEMPPVPLWLAGRAHYRQFMQRVFAIRGTGWRMLPVHANASPALAAYAPDPATRGVRAHSLQVFAVTGGLIQHCVTFADPAMFDLFGLPAGASDRARICAPDVERQREPDQDGPGDSRGSLG